MNQTINPLDYTRQDVLTVAIKFSSLIRGLLTTPQLKAALEKNRKNGCVEGECAMSEYIDTNQVLLAALGSFGIRPPFTEDHFHFFREARDCAVANEYNTVTMDTMRTQITEKGLNNDKEAIARLFNTIVGALSLADLQSVTKAESDLLAANLNGNTSLQVERIAQSTKVLNGIIQKMPPYEFAKIKEAIKTESRLLT